MKVTRTIYHAECICGERVMSESPDGIESWIPCSGDCPGGGPVVVTRVTFTARQPEAAEPEEAEGVTASEVTESD